MWEKFSIIVSELGNWSVNQVIFSYYLNNYILQKKWIWSNIQILFWFLQPSCRCQGSSGNWIWHGIDWCQSFNYITQWRIYNDQGWWLVWSHGQWRGSCHAPVWQKSISTAQVSTGIFGEFCHFGYFWTVLSTFGLLLGCHAPV